MLLPLRAWRQTVASFLRANRPESNKPRSRKSRALRLEALEPRKLMAVLYWDPNQTNGASLGGSGTWDTTSANWWNGSADVAWNNSNGDTAVFSGTSGTVTLDSGGISAGEVDFTATSYTLASGSLAVSGTGVVDVGSGLVATIGSTLNGSNGLTLTDAGLLLLSGSNSYTGTTAVNSGMLQLGSSAAINDYSTISGGGSLDFDGESLDSTISLDGFTGTLTNSSSTAASFAGTISGDEYFTITGSGNINLSGNVDAGFAMSGGNTVTLSGSNSFPNMELFSGTLQLASSAALGDATAVFYGGTLDLDGQSLDSSVTLDNFGGTLSNSNSAAASFAGTINAGNQASFSVAGTGDITLSGDITGSSSTTLTVDGSNTVSLTGTNSIDNVDLESGTLQLASADALGDDVRIDGYSGNGTLDLDGQSFDSTLIFGDFTGSLVNSSSTEASFTGTFGGGTVTVAASTGTISFDAGLGWGSLQIASAATVADGSSFSGGGTLDLDGQSLDSTITLDDFSGTVTNSSSTAVSFAGSINAGTAGDVTVAGSGDITLSGDINYAGSELAMDGDNTLILSGAASSSGTLYLESGTIQLASADAVASGSTFVASGGTLDLDGQSLDSTIVLNYFSGTLTNSSSTAASLAGSINPITSGNFTVAGSGDITLSGSIEGSGTLTKSGSGKLTLTAQDTFSGNTTINGGTLEVDDYIMRSAVTVNSGATLQGSGGTGAVTVEGGTYDADLYHITTGDSSLQDILAYAYSATGSLALAGTGYAWGLSQNDALFHALSGSATVDNVDHSATITYDVQGWGNVVGGATYAPAFQYDSDFSYTDVFDGTEDVGPALVLNDHAGYPADGTYWSNYFGIGVTEIASSLTGTISELPGQISLLSEAAGTSVATALAAGGASALTNGGTMAASGTVALAAASLASDDVGGLPFGNDLAWTNNPNAATAGGIFGHGIANLDLPQLVLLQGNTIELTDGADTRWFNLSASGVCTEQFDYHDTLVDDQVDSLFTFTDSTGNVLVFHGFGGSLAATEQGQLASYTTPGGTEAEATYTSGQLSSVAIAATVGSVTTTDTYAYTYNTTGANAGFVSNVTLDRQIGSAEPFFVQQAAYDYYTTGDTYGNTGDLKDVKIEDNASTPNVLDATYFYYYTSGSDANSVEYVLSNAAHERMTNASSTDPSSYYDEKLTYNSSNQVTELDTGVADASFTPDGSTPVYSTSSSTSDGFNDWKYKTVLQAGGQVDTYYSNFAGELLLEAQTVGDQTWYTDYKYDSAGRLVEIANPSAVESASPSSDGSLGITLDGYGGLVDDISYYSSTTATSSSAGGIAGYVESTAVQPGEYGTEALQSTTTYYQVTAGGVTVDPIAASTVYQNDDGSGAETTSFAYEFYSGTVAVKQLTTTLPTVNDQDSSSTSVNDTLKSFFNSFGQDVWDQDADGNISYTAYDAATGAVTKTVQDVSSSEATTLGGLPSGWSVGSGSHLNLTSSSVVDSLGRTTMYTDPDGNITFTVYDDPAHEVRVYQGWTWNSDTSQYVQMDSPPPTLVYRDDSSGTYSETLTMSAPITSEDRAANGAPLGTEEVAAVDSLSRELYNDKGQVDEKDDYYDLSTGSWAYSTTARLGTAYDASDLTTAANYLKTTFAYDTSGNLVHEVDSSGTITDYVHDGLNRLTRETFGTNDNTTDSHFGAVWDDSDAATGEDGPPNDMTLLYTWQYDGGGVGDSNLTQEVAYPGAQASDEPVIAGGATSGDEFASALTVSDETGVGRVTDLAYDWRDRLVAEKDGVGASLTGESDDTITQRPITYDVLDNLGELTAQYVYDGNGIALSSLGDGGAPSDTYATDLRAETTYSYDALGRVYETDVHSVEQSGSYVGDVDHGVSAEKSTVLYDGNGNVIASTNARGYTTDFVYDGANREIEEIDPQVYDASTGSYVNPTTSYGYDNDGNLTSVTDPRGAVTEYQYDAVGRETEEIDPNSTTGAASGPVTTYAYDIAGYLESVTNPLDETTSYAYDALGRQTEVIQPTGTGGLTDHYNYYPDGNVSSVTDAYGNTSTDAYNNLGELIASTDAFGTVTGYQYDTLGQLIYTTQTSPSDTSLTISDASFESLGSGPHATTSMTYDALGGVLSQTDAMNDTTTYAYNGFHELASQTDPNGGTTSFTYDANGNLAGLTDPDGNTSSYTYDALDRETSQQEVVALSIYSTGDPVPSGDWVDTTHNTLDTLAETDYGYDAAGNRVSTTDADGRVTLDSYDYLGRETQEKWFSNSSDAAAWQANPADDASTNTLDYTYNAGGLTLTAADHFSSYSYIYSGDDLQTADNNGFNGAVSTGVPDVMLSYGLNSADQLTSMSATINGVDDFVNTYSYGSDNQIATITQSGTGTDGADAVAEKRVDYSYGAGGEVATVERYTGLVALTENLVVGSQYSYDALGRLTGLKHGNSDGSTFYENYALGYDANNRVTGVTNVVTSAAIADYSGQNATYSYDANSQLSGSYDPNGNPNATGDVIGAGNRLLSDGTYTYTYDAAGNMLSRKDASGETDYTWDNRDRLTEVTDKNSSGTVTDTIAYTYDVYDNLIGRTETPYTEGVAGTATIETFAVDPTTGNVVLQFDGSGNLTDRYLWGQGVNEILTDEKVTSPDTAGTVYWALPDNLGNVVDVVASDGTLENHTAYTAYGAVNASASTATVDFLFGQTGGYTDPTTSLVKLGARWYDPATTQWLSEDPSGFGGGDANLSRYAGNDPTNMIDPSGLAAFGVPHPRVCACGAPHNVANNLQAGSGSGFGGGSYSGTPAQLAIAQGESAKNQKKKKDEARVLHELGIPTNMMNADDPRIAAMSILDPQTLDDVARAERENPYIAAQLKQNLAERIQRAERSAIIAQNVVNSGGSEDEAVDLAERMVLADFFGVTNVSNAWTGADAVTAQHLSWGQRAIQGAIGLFQLISAATMFGPGEEANAAEHEIAPPPEVPVNEPVAPTPPTPSPEPAFGEPQPSTCSDPFNCFVAGTPVVVPGVAGVEFASTAVSQKVTGVDQRSGESRWNRPALAAAAVALLLAGAELNRSRHRRRGQALTEAAEREIRDHIFGSDNLDTLWEPDDDEELLTHGDAPAPVAAAQS